MKSNFDNQFATLRLREELDSIEEEGSVTGGGEAYLPGLDVPEKKYKGLEESDNEPLYTDYDEFAKPDYLIIHLKDGRKLKIASSRVSGGKKMYDAIATALNGDKYHIVNAVIKKILQSGNLEEDKYSGYIELKGFKPGHTPDRGGFQFKQMWENEGNEDFEVGDEVKVSMQGNPENGKRAKIVGVSTQGNFYTVQLDNGKQLIYHESDLETIDDEEEDLDETMTRDDYSKVQDLLKNITVGSKLYNSILQLISDIYPHKYSDAEKLVNKMQVNENYSRFKKDTVTRSKAQQMHEASKLIEKKLKEINRLLEYASQLKSDLSEGDESFKYTHHTSKVMERITAHIAQAYSKSKKLK